MNKEEIEYMYKVLTEQWGNTDNYVNDLLSYSKRLQQENKQLKEKLNKIKEWVINMDKRDVNATYNYEKLLMLANTNIGDNNE